jgi:predicted NBD/HSP70 family sugar kinase
MSEVATGPVPTSLGRALALVHTHDVERRTELTRLLGLTRTATGTVLRELEDLCLVRSGPTSGDDRLGATGRPSHAIAVHPEAPAAVGVQVQAESLLVAELGRGGTVAAVDEILLRGRDPGRVLDLAADAVADRMGHLDRGCVGVGVAVPSAVGADGTAFSALNLGWPGSVPVGPMLQDRLDARDRKVAVHVGNDANLAAQAEHRHGAGRAATDLLYLMSAQRGVGGGLVRRGVLHTGSAGYALEVGHVSVRTRGRLCHCGNRGCLEVETDARALAEASPRVVTRRLATGLATLVNVLNPDRIVLAGLYADLLASHGDLLRADLSAQSFLDQAAHVDLRAGLLERPSLVGAAELAFRDLLTDPRAALGSD